MAASGRPVEITFTPDAAGTLVLTANFSAESDLSDWGTGANVRCFCEQSGTTSYDGVSGLGNTARFPYTLVASFAVTAGAEVKCGVYAGVTGAGTVIVYDVYVRAELIKR